MSSRPDLAIPAHLVALHFYLSGKPVGDFSASKSDHARGRGYFGYLQEVPASHPWLYLEDPGDKKKAVLGWLFFETHVSGDTCGSDEEMQDKLAMGRMDFGRMVGDAFTALLRQLSGTVVPPRSEFSESRGFSVDLPLCRTRRHPEGRDLISADGVVELAIDAIQKLSPFQIPRERLVVDTYRALFQRVTPHAWETPSVDNNSDVAIKVIFPQIATATGKFPVIDAIPDQLHQIQPSLASRGEVVIGIFVASVLAGYVSILCLSPHTSSIKARIPSQQSQICISQPTLYFSLLYVNKEFRRMGLGRKLMEAVLDPARIGDVVELAKRALIEDVEKEVRQTGEMVDVWVTVDAGNEKAGRLYEACGFVEEGRKCSVRGVWMT